ncbi:MAG: hypothetical protein ACI9DJ_003292 [Algoriphagus sp.]|jgi:hypothetical protein
MRDVLFIIGLLFSVMPQTEAQTCCSGGVPLSNSIGLPMLNTKALQVNVSYDYNNLSTLIQDKEKIDDDARTRITHTMMLQLGTAITPRLAVEVLLPYIKQDRKIVQFGNQDFTTTSGLGDITTLLNFSLLKPKSLKSLSMGLGLKAPTGAIDNRNDIGILLSSDLQPGTGAWDVLSLFRFVTAFPNKKNTSFFVNAILNFKGTDDNQQQNLSYKFGNEQQLSLGISSQVVALKRLWNLGAGLRLRNVGSNMTNGQLIASTGGRWAFGNVNLTHWIIPSKTSINVGTDIPLITSVSGLQNVPTYRINISLYSLIEYKKN